MSPRRKDVYRGRRRWRLPVTLLISIPLALIVLAVVLFYGLQKYVVYDQDGVTLAIPGLTVPAEQPGQDPAGETDAPAYSPQVDAEIVVVEPDYSDVDLHPGEDLTALRGIRLTAAEAAAGGLDTALQQAAALEADSLVLQLQTAEGYLVWDAEAEMASAYGLSGQGDLAAMVQAIREAGLRPVAELGTCVNTTLATRSPSIALKDAAGKPYQDEQGGWLDPYNQTVREYLCSLTEELAAAGFEEIVYAGLSFPENGEAVSYSQDLLGASTPRAAVSGLAVYLARNAPEGVAVSVYLDTAAVRGTGEEGAESTQDAALMTRLFDRLYLATDAASLSSDAAALEAAAGTALTVRFVPVISAVPETDSWAVPVQQSQTEP